MIPYSCVTSKNVSNASGQSDLSGWSGHVDLTASVILAQQCFIIYIPQDVSAMRQFQPTASVGCSPLTMRKSLRMLDYTPYIIYLDSMEHRRQLIALNIYGNIPFSICVPVTFFDGVVWS